MRFLKKLFVIVMGSLMLVSSAYAQQAFIEFCAKSYLEKSLCPTALCQLKCAGKIDQKDCPKICLPKDCATFNPEDCPKEFCFVETDCSQRKTCQIRSDEDQTPECGPLAYSRQDVDCCKGLVRRCGFDYLDGKCNMQGKNTAYHLPICIPCGDGVCTNFENHCNCPEDCKKDIIPLK